MRLFLLAFLLGGCMTPEPQSCESEVRTYFPADASAD